MALVTAKEAGDSVDPEATSAAPAPWTRGGDFLVACPGTLKVADAPISNVDRENIHKATRNLLTNFVPRLAHAMKCLDHVARIVLRGD